MGSGQPPGVDLDSGGGIDPGTLPRIGSPTPAPIGLDSKSGSAKNSGPSMAERIVTFARQRRGERVGDGECYTLTDRALRGADARSASDYGTITPNADYVWGTEVPFADVRPGDVIQFRSYRFVKEVVEETDSETRTTEEEQERLHHTAIVASVDGNGAITVWEQNSPEGSAVTQTQLFFRGGSSTSGRRTTTVTVSGRFWFYRPQPR